jgi:hypothetical protein
VSQRTRSEAVKAATKPSLDLWGQCLRSYAWQAASTTHEPAHHRPKGKVRMTVEAYHMVALLAAPLSRPSRKARAGDIRVTGDIYVYVGRLGEKRT